MTYPKIPLAQTVISLCKLKGVKHIVISPGSRNAPLTIGFTNDSFFRCYSIVDERCAAFFALGIAQSTKEPTAVVCTSGSALLNYYPAVSEAYYSRIPLIVLSADRPKHLIGIGDGQTINQKNVFDSHILYSANLKLDIKDENNLPLHAELPLIKNLEDKFERLLGLQKDIQIYNEEEFNMAINLAIVKKGPTHVNIPFDEPLYEVVNTLNVSPTVVEMPLKNKDLEEYELRSCVEEWNSATKKMILVGVCEPNYIDNKWLEEITEDDSVIVMTETTSNLHHPSFFPSIDKLIAPLTKDEQKAFKPDILITFGGLIVSKKIKQLLRLHKPKHHWHIDLHHANDTFFSLSRHIRASPNQFFEQFLPRITYYVKSRYKNTWTAVMQKRREKHSLYLRQVPFSDFSVFSLILKTIPRKYAFQVGNSSAIRYTQLFKLDKTLEVYCNRGTSGIDGSTSTAIGFAAVSEKPTLLVTGDLSFFYDSNALWNNYIPKNFRIIVINNQGGGIFRILPGRKNTENFGTFFETSHELSAEHLCKMYGFEYASANNTKDLEGALEGFYAKGNSPKLLEVFTPSRVNDEVLLNYFEFLK